MSTVTVVDVNKQGKSKLGPFHTLPQNHPDPDSTDTEWAAAAPNLSDSDIHSKNSLDSLALSPIPTAIPTSETTLDLDSIFMYNDPVIHGHINSTPEKNQKNRQTIVFSPTFSIYKPEFQI